MTIQREPAYQALARDLRSAILRDEYPEGAKLPTEAELSARYGLSRQTVRRSFHELVSEGVVYRVAGRGTFPVPRNGHYSRQFGSIDDLMGLALDTKLEVLTPLRRQINVQAASRLRLPNDTVYTVTYRRHHDGLPLCHTAIHIDPEVGRQLEDVPELSEVGRVSELTVLALIDARLSEPILEAEQRITAEAATAMLAETLGCEIGDPLLVLDRVCLTRERKYVELSISHFLPHRYSYQVMLRRNTR